jgi:hypothetical protein
LGKYKQKDLSSGLPTHEVKRYFKNNIKRAGGMAQVVDSLPSKLKALSSSTSLKKKREGLA